MRPATRRHGVFVVTSHRKRGWTHPATRKRLTFVEMIAYLNSVAATLTTNSVGEIAVTVIGIDAVKKLRKRAGDKSKKTPAKKKAVEKPTFAKRSAKSKNRSARR